MCIVCHYNGDNQLVTERGHGTLVLCISDGICRDCHQDGVATTHVCDTLHQIVADPEVRNSWRDRKCPKCGAEPGNLCWSKGYDQYGPRTPTRKSIPCAVRRR